MIIALGLLTWQGIRSSKNSFPERAGWLIIIASGLSNLIDRLIWGGVWDWIVYPVLNVVGNIADILLGIGVLIVFLATWHKNKRFRVK